MCERKNWLVSIQKSWLQGENILSLESFNNKGGVLAADRSPALFEFF